MHDEKNEARSRYDHLIRSLAFIISRLTSEKKAMLYFIVQRCAANHLITSFGHKNVLMIIRRNILAVTDIEVQHAHRMSQTIT
jgi:hypothetical protein